MCVCLSLNPLTSFHKTQMRKIDERIFKDLR